MLTVHMPCYTIDQKHIKTIIAYNLSIISMRIPSHVFGNKAKNIYKVMQNSKIYLLTRLWSTYVPADADSKIIKHNINAKNILVLQ